ncbi:ABC transporter substrate-binding protein [Adhaeribacter aerolatus]|uniref:ABC transporter substrate-binding protein n=1 Tax=Adhaeribacter aerolatus TaxID=670289 RepID=A0A512B0K9_9BACT|nr:two-component regulator propeller domain-containing protein [Adhaeribacter aerolatus]GEO05327.1 ABC transporter substrate-binding protein [Adhaeribacter aerolatus]
MPVKVILILLLGVAAWLSSGLALLAQSSNLLLGHWQMHQPNQQAKVVAAAEDKIYCATEDGFFYYDKTYNQLKTLSKVDGFSDVNISTLAYEPQTKTLIIAYQNTNIDLLQDGEIININAILRKQLPQEKYIYHIMLADKQAYLSCSFGVVLLDLVKHEINETYSNLGPNGAPVAVFASTILHDSLYLATANGMMAARRSNNNLLDFHNWKTFTPADGLPVTHNPDFRQVTTFNNKIFAAVNNDAVYLYNGSRWQKTIINLQNKQLHQLTAYPDFLLLANGEQLLLLDKNNNLTTKAAPGLQNPRYAVPEAGNTFWIADYQKGLVKLTGATTEILIPNGPLFSTGFRMYADSKNVYVVNGAYDETYKPQESQQGFEVLNARQWKSFNSFIYPDVKQYPLVQDLVGVVRNPVNQKLYLASYGDGLLEWEDLGKYKLYHSANSPLLRASPGNEHSIFLTDLTSDADGNIWVVNRHQNANAPGLHVLRMDGSWNSFSFPGFPDSGNLERIIIDNNGYKWMTVSKNNQNSGGILVYDEIKNAYRHLITAPAMGNLPGSAIYALVKDKHGYVWAGTDKGVAVFYEPENIFTANTIAATIPVLNRRPLLVNQLVRAIAVDGGNRKWVGTDNGLWLLSEAGETVVAHYTTENSPLPADKIQDITVNHSTGEVFISTPNGLISVRGTATETTGKPDCASVYPNPVRPGYTGLVGISGLPNNALVKITDTAGNLVYQAHATGGTLAWDLRDGNGKRVKSGVYLAFSASANGKQSCTSKIAVIGQ